MKISSLLFFAMMASVALSQEEEKGSITLGFHKFILPYFSLDTDALNSFATNAYKLGIIPPTGYSLNTTTGNITFALPAATATTAGNNICTNKPSTDGLMCYLDSVFDSEGNVLCSGLNLCNTEIEPTNVPVTFSFHRYILPYLMMSEDAQTKFIVAAYALGVDSKLFMPDKTTGDLTFYVSATAATNIKNGACNINTYPADSMGYWKYLKTIKDAEGNVLCDNLNICDITIEPTNVPVTFSFHRYILPYLTSEDAQSAFIVAAYALGIDSKTFMPDTATGDLTFYVSATAANNIKNGVCNINTYPADSMGYWKYLKTIKDAEGNVFCDNLNICDITIEPTNVPITFGFHNNILPNLLDSTKQSTFIMTAFALGVDSINVVTDTTTGEATFYVSATAANYIKSTICSAKYPAESMGYWSQLKYVVDAEGNTICDNLNICGITIEKPTTAVTFGFYKYILPYLLNDQLKLSFISAAYGLGVDSINLVTDTDSGNITFYVTPSAAAALEKNICTDSMPSSGNMCFLESLIDAEGNTLCSGLNICGIEIEKTNVPVTFGFYKNVLLELDGNSSKQLEFVMAAYALGVDSKTFMPDKTTGELTFYVSSSATKNVEQSICNGLGTAASEFCFLKTLKDAQGNVLCSDLNLCNLSLEEQPAQVVSVSISFEDAPFDFDSLYHAVAVLQGGSSSSSNSSSSSSSSSPSVSRIILDDTGKYFNTVIISVELPFGSGSSPLLNTICNDSPLLSHTLFCNVKSIRLTNTGTSLCANETLNLCSGDKPIETGASSKTQISGLVLFIVLVLSLFF